MLKKVYVVKNKKTDEIYHSKKGIKYYDCKGNAKNLGQKLVKKGIPAEDLSIVGYMLMIVEIDDKGVEV